MTTKKKYEALVTIWANDEKRYVKPGEIFERTDKQAKSLLEKKFIKPVKAEAKPTGKGKES